LFSITEPQNSIDEEPLITPTDDGSEILNNIEMKKLKNYKKLLNIDDIIAFRIL
jgi:hypothetical protein